MPARDKPRRITLSHCRIKPQSKGAQRELGLDDSGWSAGVTGGEQLNELGVVRFKREETDERKQVCRMRRSGNMCPGGCTHPGTDAGPMHAGAVMRRMLEFMRHCVPGRHGQQDQDGTGHHPHDASQERTSHKEPMSYLGAE